MQENSYPRQRPGDFYYRHNHTVMAPDMPCGDVGVSLAEETMRSNDIDTSWMEDLGPTWLWNMEPPLT